MERVINVLWHFSTLDFINLPQNLLWDENEFYKKCKSTLFKFAYSNVEDYKPSGGPDLWELSQKVRIMLINGERFLDFPRPLPHGIQFLGQVSAGTKATKKFPPELERIVEQARTLVVFSLGTVSNTTNMPALMLNAFVEAFGRFPKVDFLWRMEMDVPEAAKYKNIHLLKWLPQKELVGKYKNKMYFSDFTCNIIYILFYYILVLT